MQENNEVFQRLLYVDSEFIKANNKRYSLITGSSNISSTAELSKYERELTETSNAMMDLQDRGDQLSKEYVKSINDSSDIFLTPKDLPKLMREHIVDIADALIANHYKYIQKNSDNLPNNVISLWQERISNLKSARKYIQDQIDESYQKMANDVDYKGELYTDEDEIALIRILNSTASNSNNISSNVPSNILSNVSSNTSSNAVNNFKYCTKCGTKLNADAMFCSNCGNKFSEVGNKSAGNVSNVHFHEESVHIHGNISSNFSCPNCGSENVQSLPIIYQSGSSGTSAITGATNFIAVTKGNTMTDLARSVAPPTQKEKDSALFTCCVIAALICLFIGVIIGAIGFAVVAFIAYIPIHEAETYNKERFPIDYDNWRNSYLCHRCGTVFRR